MTESWIVSFVRFHVYVCVYGHHSVDEPTQLVNLRVEGIGTVPRAWRERIAPRHDHDRQRPVYVQGEGWLALDTPVLDRSRLKAGETYPGPLVVEQLDTTRADPRCATSRGSMSKARSSWRSR